MPVLTVSRTLVKSPPELWTELRGDRLADAVGEVSVRPVEAERSLEWTAAGASGTARLEPAGWGTRVVLTARIDEPPLRRGRFGRLGRGPRPVERREDLERRLDALLDTLGADQRKPFAAGH